MNYRCLCLRVLHLVGLILMTFNCISELYYNVHCYIARFIMSLSKFIKKESLIFIRNYSRRLFDDTINLITTGLLAKQKKNML